MIKNVAHVYHIVAIWAGLVPAMDYNYFATPCMVDYKDCSDVRGWIPALLMPQHRGGLHRLRIAEGAPIERYYHILISLFVFIISHDTIVCYDDYNNNDTEHGQQVIVNGTWLMLAPILVRLNGTVPTMCLPHQRPITICYYHSKNRRSLIV